MIEDYALINDFNEYDLDRLKTFLKRAATLELEDWSLYKRIFKLPHIRLGFSKIKKYLDKELPTIKPCLESEKSPVYNFCILELFFTIF